MKYVTSPVWPARLDKSTFVTSVTGGCSRVLLRVTQKDLEGHTLVELFLPNETDSHSFRIIYIFSGTLRYNCVFHAFGEHIGCVVVCVLIASACIIVCST